MRPVDPLAPIASIPGVDLAGARSIADVQEALIAAGLRRRADRILRYGYSPDCTCSGCGDTGVYGGTEHRPCHCVAGSNVAGVQVQAKAWEEWIPAGYRGYTLDLAPSGQAAAAVRRYMLRGAWRSGQNLLLAGRPGCGKTGLAVAALRMALFEFGEAVGFEFVPDFLRSQMPTEDKHRELAGEARMSNAKGRTVLVLDDLGASNWSEFADRTVLEVLDERIRRGKPTIVTTNLDPLDIPDLLGERVARRLLSGSDYVTEWGQA